MTEPVAEVVERAPKVPDEVLDAMANDAWDRIGSMSMEAVREMFEAALAAAWYEGFDLVYRASEPVERLSRERDTGVPEGFWLAPNELDDAMIEACAGAFFAAFDKRVSGSSPFHRWYEAIRSAAPQPPTVSTQGWQDESFQSRVQPWMLACFGAEIAADRLERSDRFIEEALELVQASGYTKDRAHQLVEYVFGRDQGEINQEVGGVMVTLAAYCLAHGIDMHAAAEKELARVWTKVDVIRAKQASKPKGSALPIPVNSPDLSSLTRERDQARKALAENQADVSSFLKDYERGPGYISVPTHRLERLDRINRSVLDPEKEGSK